MLTTCTHLLRVIYNATILVNENLYKFGVSTCICHHHRCQAFLQEAEMDTEYSEMENAKADRSLNNNNNVILFIIGTKFTGYE